MNTFQEAAPQEPKTSETTTAPATPLRPGNDAPQSLFAQYGVFIFLFVIIYFMMIRPAGRQRKERQAMLDGIKKNDHILTSGGLYGVVVKVRDNDIDLRIDDKNDVRVRIARSGVVGVEKSAGGVEEPAVTASKDK